MDFLKGYKTVVFNVVMAGIALVHVFNPGAELPGAEAVQGATDSFMAGVAAIWGVGGVVLRALTNSTMFKKTSPAPMPPASGGAS